MSTPRGGVDVHGRSLLAVEPTHSVAHADALRKSQNLPVPHRRPVDPPRGSPEEIGVVTLDVVQRIRNRADQIHYI